MHHGLRFVNVAGGLKEKPNTRKWRNSRMLYLRSFKHFILISIIAVSFIFAGNASASNVVIIPSFESGTGSWSASSSGSFGGGTQTSFATGAGAGVDAQSDHFYIDNVRADAASAVPVPAAIWLFGTALIGMVGFGKRKKAA